MFQVIRSNNSCHLNALFGTKFLEMGGGLFTSSNFSASFNLSSSGDHAGLRCFVQIHTFFAEFNLVDIRHWDYENNTWAHHE